MSCKLHNGRTPFTIELGSHPRGPGGLAMVSSGSRRRPHPLRARSRPQARGAHVRGRRLLPSPGNATAALAHSHSAGLTVSPPAQVAVKIHPEIVTEGES